NAAGQHDRDRRLLEERLVGGEVERVGFACGSAPERGRAHGGLGIELHVPLGVMQVTVTMAASAVAAQMPRRTTPNVPRLPSLSSVAGPGVRRCSPGNVRTSGLLSCPAPGPKIELGPAGRIAPGEPRRTARRLR